MNPWLIIGFTLIVCIGYEGSIVEFREWLEDIASS
jgi:hypothetical protein